MKDTKKILRQAVYDAINGNVLVNSLPVVVREEKLASSEQPSIYIILSTQQENTIERNGSSFITQSSIDIEITHQQGSEANKDVIDDVYEQILNIVFPTPTTIGLTVPSDFQFQEGFRESCITQSVSISPTETIVQEKFRLVFIINEK